MLKSDAFLGVIHIILHLGVASGPHLLHSLAKILRNLLYALLNILIDELHYLLMLCLKNRVRFLLLFFELILQYLALLLQNFGRLVRSLKLLLVGIDIVTIIKEQLLDLLL